MAAGWSLTADVMMCMGCVCVAAEREDRSGEHSGAGTGDAGQQALEEDG